MPGDGVVGGATQILRAAHRVAAARPPAGVCKNVSRIFERRSGGSQEPLQRRRTSTAAAAAARAQQAGPSSRHQPRDPRVTLCRPQDLIETLINRRRACRGVRRRGGRRRPTPSRLPPVWGAPRPRNSTTRSRRQIDGHQRRRRGARQSRTRRLAGGLAFVAQALWMLVGAPRARRRSSPPSSAGYLRSAATAEEGGRRRARWTPMSSRRGGVAISGADGGKTRGGRRNQRRSVRRQSGWRRGSRSGYDEVWRGWARNQARSRRGWRRPLDLPAAPRSRVQMTLDGTARQHAITTSALLGIWRGVDRRRRSRRRWSAVGVAEDQQDVLAPISRTSRRADEVAAHARQAESELRAVGARRSTAVCAMRSVHPRRPTDGRHLDVKRGGAPPTARSETRRIRALRAPPEEAGRQRRS